MANFTYYFSLFGHLMWSCFRFFQWWLVAVSRKIAAIAQIEWQEWPCILVQRTKTRDLWIHFVRMKRKNFHPGEKTRFVICSVYFEESCFTRVSAGKSYLDPFLRYGKRRRKLKFRNRREVNT